MYSLQAAELIHRDRRMIVAEYNVEIHDTSLILLVMWALCYSCVIIKSHTLIALRVLLPTQCCAWVKLCLVLSVKAWCTYHIVFQIWASDVPWCVHGHEQLRSWCSWGSQCVCVVVCRWFLCTRRPPISFLMSSSSACLRTFWHWFTGFPRVIVCWWRLVRKLRWLLICAILVSVHCSVLMKRW